MIQGRGTGLIFQGLNTLQGKAQQVQEDRAPRVDLHSVLSSNLSTLSLLTQDLFAYPFVTVDIPRYCGHLPAGTLPLVLLEPLCLNCSLCRFNHCLQRQPFSTQELARFFFRCCLIRLTRESLWNMFPVQESPESRGSSPATSNMLGIAGMTSREAFLPRKLSTDYLSSVPRSLLHPQTPPDSTSASPIVKPEGMCCSLCRQTCLFTTQHGTADTSHQDLSRLLQVTSPGSAPRCLD